MSSNLFQLFVDQLLAQQASCGIYREMTRCHFSELSATVAAAAAAATDGGVHVVMEIIIVI